MYNKAWLIPFDEGPLGIGYERDDGIRGFIRVDRSGHPELPKLMNKLSDTDLHKLEARLSNVIPFPGAGAR